MRCDQTPLFGTCLAVPCGLLQDAEDERLRPLTHVNVRCGLYASERARRLAGMNMHRYRCLVSSECGSFAEVAQGQVEIAAYMLYSWA